MADDTYLFIRKLKDQLNTLKNRLDMLETATTTGPITYINSNNSLVAGTLVAAASSITVNPITLLSLPTTVRSVLITGYVISAGAGYLYFDKTIPIAGSTFFYSASGSTRSFHLLVPIASDGSLYISATGNNMTVTCQVNGYLY